MNREDLIQFLNEKPGYIKKSARVLAERTDSNYELCREVLKEAAAHQRKEDQRKSKFIQGSKIKRIKKWQLYEGDWRESIEYANDEFNIEEWRAFSKEFTKDIKSYSPTVPKLPKKKLKDPVAYEISLPDFHLGKITGESLEEQKQLFINTVKKMHDKAKGLEIEKFILPIGNDGMNSEGLSMKTTKGTPQHDNAEWKETFRGYWEMMVDAVNYLTEYAPVDIIVVCGNHDYERAFYAGDVLKAWFHNNPNVKVDNSFEPRKYYIYGVNLLGFTHGDKEKPNDLPLIMATEKPKEFADSKYQEWHTGHLHKHMVNEYRGIAVKFLPSICGNDTWHKMMGYSAKRKAQGYIWSRTRGCEGFIQYNHIDASV